jgi:hypothetical protein
MTLDISFDDLIVIDNVVTDAYTLVTDEYGRARDQLANIVLTLIAERTTQRLFTAVSLQATSLPKMKVYSSFKQHIRFFRVV